MSCVLAAAVVGMGVWAFNAQSSADDAEAKLASQAQAASAATSAPTPVATPPAAATPTPTPVDAATQEQFQQVATDLGVTGDSVDEIRRQLDQAAAKVKGAEQARADAKGVVDTAKTEADAIKARFELTRTCLRGALDALGSSFKSGGPEAAVAQLQALSGNCASAASS
jgi:hypothetical protein